ncbi:dihydropteroate synthase [Neptuniibacter sp. QD29_5]|uniref:dihydropteroate synthase n=1 Tax=Neptuniibacter sp. QD29_5 TaxID=3398207 RepID=UPI0039F51620
MRQLVCGNRTLNLADTHVMGILNVTPDSFSDGGTLYSNQQVRLDNVIRQAEGMVTDGATILDVGGESTRPGAAPVTLDEELGRVLPVVEKIASELDVVISVDTSTPEVITESVKLGAGLINDVRALGREGALVAAAKTNLPICLMHMQGSPATMQDAPSYDDVLDDVEYFLLQRVKACEAAGITKDRLLLDPGFGFGKSVEHNLRLMNNLDRLKQHDLPILIGTSRKSMIGAVLNREVEQRLPGSLATVALAVMQGAEIIRVHDVAETVDVVKMTRAVMAETV